MQSVLKSLYGDSTHVPGKSFFIYNQYTTVTQRLIYTRPSVTTVVRNTANKTLDASENNHITYVTLSAKPLLGHAVYKHTQYVYNLQIRKVMFQTKRAQHQFY